MVRVTLIAVAWKPQIGSEIFSSCDPVSSVRGRAGDEPIEWN